MVNRPQAHSAARVRCSAQSRAAGRPGGSWFLGKSRTGGKPWVRVARAANAPDVTDSEIKIGQTFPYSGPASGYGVIARAEAAYFKMINEKGGVNGRKLNLI